MQISTCGFSLVSGVSMHRKGKSLLGFALQIRSYGARIPRDFISKTEDGKKVLFLMTDHKPPSGVFSSNSSSLPDSTKKLKEPEILGKGSYVVPIINADINPDFKPNPSSPESQVFLEKFGTLPQNQVPEDRSIEITRFKYRKGVDNRVGLFAIKLGMISFYDKWGKYHPCSVLQVADNQVFETFHQRNDHIYCSVAAVKKSVSDLRKSQRMRFLKYGMYPRQKVGAWKVSRECILPPGTPIYACHFVPGQAIRIQGKSKGKGFQGAVKRWGFKKGNKTHGSTKCHRRTGAVSTRGKGCIWKGKKMPGRMGFENRTVFGEILRIDNALNLIFFRGHVPGPKGRVLKLSDVPDQDFFDTNPPPCPTYVPGVDSRLPRIMDSPAPKEDPVMIRESDMPQAI